MEKKKRRLVSFLDEKNGCTEETMSKGFTLIELLVVVLIIGILSAVALPQYEMAVEKARFTQALTAQKALVDAEQIYYMANGNYTSNLGDLDISFPGNALKDFSLLIHTSPNLHIQMQRNKQIGGHTIWATAYLLDANRPETGCTLSSSVPSSSKARRLCKLVSGEQTPQTLEAGYDTYLLHG